MRWIKAKLSALRDKIVKERKPAGFIARGWALGVFVGSVIPFGFQIYIALPLSFLFRCSKIGSLTGTLITNPVSIVFIYPAQCWIGSRILGGKLSWGAISEALQGVLANQDWASLMELSGHLIASFFIGGFLLAAIATPIAYFSVLATVNAYRRRGDTSDIQYEEEEGS
ncbi:MAG: DUF2062 domain-containing protein [Kiritimatiellae bacterium]|nr:DUF2062 domain-containing protein [Kiritimatiellia bacterium]